MAGLERRFLPNADLSVDHQVLEQAAATADFVVLPERMREVRGNRIAPFRREVQQLRGYIRESGHTVALAVPRASRRRLIRSMRPQRGVQPLRELDLESGRTGARL